MGNRVTIIGGGSDLGRGPGGRLSEHLVQRRRTAFAFRREGEDL